MLYINIIFYFAIPTPNRPYFTYNKLKYTYKSPYVYKKVVNYNNVSDCHLFIKTGKAVIIYYLLWSLYIVKISLSRTPYYLGHHIISDTIYLEHISMLHPFISNISLIYLFISTIFLCSQTSSFIKHISMLS